MHTNNFKAILTIAARVLAILSFATAAHGQVNLTAAPTSATMPDGTVVPMWGYFCGPTVSTSTATCAALNPASQTAATGSTGAVGTWSPVVITVPLAASGPTSLTINLTNNLSFTPTGATQTNVIPTSLVMVGQVGGGLGNTKLLTSTQSPSHATAQECPSWFIAANPPGTPCTAPTPNVTTNTPPVQANRVQSLAAEVSAVAATTAATCSVPSAGPVTGCGTLTWTNLRPGTYLLQSGTHQSIQVPMGLIGVLVVTTAPTTTTAGITPGTAYPGTTTLPAVQYNAEVPLEFSEIDPVQNNAVNTAVNTANFSETRVWSGLPSDPQGNPGCGNPASSTYNTCYPPVVNYTPFYYLINGVAFNKTNVSGSLFTATAGVSGTPPTPVTTGIAGTVLVRLVNAGVRMHVPSMVGSITQGFNGAGATATVSGFTLIAEDGNPVPGVQVAGAPAAPRVQTDVFMAAGKVFDVMVNVPTGSVSAIAITAGGLGFLNGGSGTLPACSTTVTTGCVLISGGGGTGATATATVNAGVITAFNITNPGNGYTAQPNVAVTDVAGSTGAGLTVGTVSIMGIVPIYARDLGLSANSSTRDAGMIAYIGANGTPSAILAGAGIGAGAGGAGAATSAFAAPVARPDTYNAVPACASGATSCVPLVVSDVSRGVIANDTNVYGVTLVSPPDPTQGTLSCAAQPQNTVPGLCANGTFTFTPKPNFSGATFAYCANGAAAGTTGLCTTVTLSLSTLSAGSPTAVAQSYTARTSTYIKIQSPGLLLGNTDPNNLPLRVVVPATLPTGVVAMDANGGFIASGTSGTLTFPYTVQNSLGGMSASGTVTVTFPTPSNLTVNVLDAQAYSNCQGDSTCISKLAGTSASITDYRWIIEEDKTFWVDPNCTTNTSTSTTTPTTTPGCPSVVAAGGTVPTFGTNFHASHLDYVAQGCTGPLSCESGQTMLDTRAVCTSPGVPAGCSATAGQHIPAVCDLGNGACRPDPNCTALPCLTSGGTTPVMPSSVHLDPTKRYYISVLPGDAGNPFPANTSPPDCSAPPISGSGTGATLNTACGHTMSGAQIAAACNIFANSTATPCTSTTTATFAPVTVKVLPTPLPTAKLTVFVFEDDFPLNGEQDGGGGNGTVAPIEPGLGGFEIILWDTYGGLGDFTGQDTHDMFNQPLSNSLAGTIDPATGLDACPISAGVTANVLGTGNNNPVTNPIGAQAGITGRIVTCPKYESDNATLSPLAGQAVIANLMPDKFSVQAYPGADRIARGEEWLQTNTLDGQHPHDAFLRIGEPGYFTEFGPSGYHVSIGFANPKIINARYTDVCAGAYGAVGSCNNIIEGQVDVQRVSRTPDQRLYPSGSRDALAWTQCWVSLGDPDAEDFMFTKCDANGNFKFTNVPGGNWRVTIGDQWNDQIIDGLSTPANVGCVPTPPATKCTAPPATLNLGNIGVQQWQSNLYTRLFVDDNKNGILDPGEIGVPQVYTRIKYRDGHNANTLLTDPNGVANFNETFPLFNWYVVEPDLGRYKRTGTHTVYDAGGPADGSTYCGTANGARACGTSAAYQYLANTHESLPLPADLSVPGAVYCTSADCATEAVSFAAGTAIASSPTASTGRIDPPWVNSEGWSGLTSHGNWIEFGVAPYAPCPPACATVPNAVNNPTAGGTTATTKQVGENGGIHGHTTYAATRPFDDASQMIEQPWSPNVPGVTVNLYQEGFAADGVTPTLTLVDTTVSTSWDDWAQGFYPGSTAGSGTGAGQKPYMSCPGQGTQTGTNADVFYFSLFDQPEYLDWYNSLHNGGTLHTLPYNSQYKCYDSMHIADQAQPAPYDGYYTFPSITGINATTGAALGTNCTICVNDPDSDDHYRYSAPGTNGLWNPANGGAPMLPPGKYVVEVIMPPGYEVYKEEDKNLLIGDNFIAPATVQFAGLGGSIFIMPDQASVASLYDPSGAGYNGTNYQNQTTALGTNEQLALPGYPGFQDPIWPCVGEMRVVPDYLSLFPQDLETAPFAGATRPLCDRKEVTLVDQMSVSVKFYIFTSTHIAAKFTGVITDDLTSEFDPFSPQFGEKFSPPNLPVATKDYLGNELSRVYSDHWGTYESVNFSSWDVNPPNITGYGPSMMVQCMNDVGPILDTRGAMIPDPNNPGGPLIPNLTNGQMIPDPLYNSAYSQFCYEEPYMPGLTTYLDTPVVPTQAFVGAAYNNPDCAYPDTTPAIAEVDGDEIGPWVSAAGKTLTITALGNVQVDNSGYAGPAANTPPFNLKKVQRHYGFGTQCTALSTTCTAISGVTIGGIAVPAANITTWNDSQIVLTVPTGIPACAIQQQAQYQTVGTRALSAAAPANCGQVVITAGNGRQSVDAVTVTVGGKPPTHVAASQTIQGAIDAAAPGDLLMIDPTCTATTAGVSTNLPTCTTSAAGAVLGKVAAAHQEMLLMWKPVRLQGVGAVSSVINANAQPAGKLLDPWRRHVNCLFGLTLSGVPRQGIASGTTAPPFDSTGTYNCPDAGWSYYTTPTTQGVPQVDRLPLEAVVGWDAIVNGNLAEQLQEPSLMGAYEGAGITVLGKGVWTSPGENIWSDSTEGGAFPPDALLLQDVPASPDDEGAALGPQYSWCFTMTATGSTKTELVPNPYPSNFECNPSSIDGLTVTDSSQGGGGVFVHGWAHNLQIANNRVYNNAGTLSGGISIGQGEFPIALTAVDQEGTAGLFAPLGEFVVDNPPSCLWIPVIGVHLPYCLDVNVNVHNNFITNNASLGDELFSGTLSGGGGATFCTGSDYYKFNYNWVCGNLSAGEGGGVVHLGFIYNGDIEHNSILLNQSSNPTIPTNGGGIMVQGTPDTDPVCGTLIDQDCPPGLSDGTGPNLVINANLIEANSADSGAGGGIRLNQVNGTDVSTFPNGCVIPGLGALVPTIGTFCPLGHPASFYWNSVSITNNIIVNNIAGWDGAGISLQDALNVSIVNNTIAHNDSLASSGVLTFALGTPEASAPAGECHQPGPTGANTASCPQVAGVASTRNSALLTTTFTPLPTCPVGQSSTTACRTISNPVLANNIIWQNRSFQIGISGPGLTTQNQQNLVTLYNASFAGTTVGGAIPAQTFTGQCTAGSSYWDVGVRGDTGPTNHTGGTLSPTNSVLSSGTYTGSGNSTTAPPVLRQYCNGSRVAPECSVAEGCGGPNGFGVPPGINDAVTPNPRFSLIPAATVDEGNNWINVSWGPLALTNPAVPGPANPGAAGGDYGGGAPLANYSLSAAIDSIPTSVPHPATDFFGNPRPDAAVPTAFDPGAVEFVGGTGGGGGCSVAVSPSTLAFGNQVVGTTSATQNVTIHNGCTTNATTGTFTFGGGLVEPFARVTTGTFPAGAPNCTATLVAGASCTIKVDFAPLLLPATYSRTLTVAYAAGVTVTGSPVALTGTAIAPVRTATVSGGPLAFGTVTPGTTSPSQTLTVTNTGNVALAGGTLTFGGGTPQPFSRPAGAAGGTCTATLAVGASCTINVVFTAPTTSATFSRTLTVAYPLATVTGSPVTLSGTG